MNISQHIIRVTAEHFKNVKVIDFVPNRYVTKISGANGAGKTSVLDVLFWCLAPRKTLTADFIRRGQKKGFLRVETETHIITRRLDDKGGSLEVELKTNGTLVKDPVDWLEKIAGELGFDPLKFRNMKPEQQFEVLRGLVELEADVDDLEVRNENDAKTVTERTKEMKQLRAARDRITIDKTLPKEPVDIDALLAEARAVTEHNRKVEQETRERYEQRNVRNALILNIEERTRRIAELEEDLKEQRDAQATASARLEAANAAMMALPPLEILKDRAELDERISAASANNSRITVNNANREQFARYDQDADKIEIELDAMEKQIRERKLKIARTLEQAKFPVPGLSFETLEEGSSGRERKNPKKIVTYHGIPLADCSSAEQIRVSTAIGMANKPKLRFLLIREGSLLDESGWEILEQMAHENDFQILCEVVDTSGRVGIFMQDGEIKAVNTEPEPEAPTPAPRGRQRKPRNEKQGELIK